MVFSLLTYLLAVLFLYKHRNKGKLCLLVETIYFKNYINIHDLQSGLLIFKSSPSQYELYIKIEIQATVNMYKAVQKR